MDRKYYSSNKKLHFRSSVPVQSKVHHQKLYDYGIFGGSIDSGSDFITSKISSKKRANSLQISTMTNISQNDDKKKLKNIPDKSIYIGCDISSTESFTSLASMRSSESNDLENFEIGFDSSPHDLNNSSSVSSKDQSQEYENYLFSDLNQNVKYEELEEMLQEMLQRKRSD
ncbi:hypothetical protein AYI68_g6218 [Smittium mucronatum]|uniref:Uncharacterized protein n=1 Tax=Smittium mucronatum TaxID=133383 RepID=A0A1R0GS24_9FUNG|nr:hypothetical protein AYI68_g6218 [Smittium mucronatum]